MPKFGSRRLLLTRAVFAYFILEKTRAFHFISNSEMLSFHSRRFFGRDAAKIQIPLRQFWMSSSAAAAAGVTEKFDHLKVEKKWQNYWEKNKTFKAVRRPGKEKKYILDMFPYPSGSGLHVGHPEGYTASDIMARYYRMKDFDVLHPMGWDSFGLPAEQHAINTGTHPRDTTIENIQTFKRQLKSLGFSFDWDREIATTDTDYVRWTQWIFLQLFKTGLAMQSEVLVNWCPALGTVLANEEVINGLSERGNHPVKRVPLRQWVFKITDYADKLEAGLDEGLQWPEGTRSAQKAWIGKSVGASIDFQVLNSESKFSVFTTRPDTLLGVTYVVLAPEHPLVKTITTASQRKEIEAYVELAASKSDMDRMVVGKDKSKSGVPTGAFAEHPISGEKVPIWVGDYVLGGYGTGAVMAVPAHDERDWEFATKFGLPIQQVVKPIKGEASVTAQAFIEPGVSVNSGKFDGLSTEDCKAAVIRELERLGKGGAQITYKLRDWVFSRQRYWGEPIPIYFPVTMQSETGDPRKGDAHTIEFSHPIPVKEEDLPLTLPEMDDFKPGDDPAGCLARAKDWRYFQKDGQWFSRETNTMPQWAGSCWYYLRFTDNCNSEQAWSKKADDEWLPVDLYVGGQEHAVLHLLYARFWHKVLYDLGFTQHPEPFRKLIHQGMILGSDNEKMSKSRGNVVNPDDVIQESGADSLRLYEMFMGPLEATKPWQTSQVLGVVRFRDRVYNLATRELSQDIDDQTLRLMHKTIKKVTQDIESMAFNTAIAQMMVFSNHLSSMTNPPRPAVEALTLLVSPFAPHTAEESWEKLGKSQGTVAYEPWPVYDEALCVDSTVTLAIQVNGKVRATMDIVADADEKTATEKALAEYNVKKFLEGKSVLKIIYKQGKIMNIVAK